MNNLLYVVKQQPDEHQEIVNARISETIKLLRKHNCDFIFIAQINHYNATAIKTLLNENMLSKPNNKLFCLITEEFDNLFLESSQNAIEDRCSFIINSFDTFQEIFIKWVNI